MDSAEYIEQLRKKYMTFLKRKIGGHPFEPIPLRGIRNIPDNHEQFFTQTAVFNKFNKEITGKGWTIAWRETKRLGRQKWPTSITVDTEDDYLFLIGKKAATEKLFKRFDQLIQWKPELRSFFEAHPKLIEEYEQSWDKLIGSIDFLLQNDVKGMLIRDIQVPADTKFLENHRTIVFQLLKYLAPQRGVPESKTLQEYLELSSMADYRRMKWLGQEIAQKYTDGEIEFYRKKEWLKKLPDEIDEIWLVENMHSLYKIPFRNKALAIFSGGFSLHLLKEMPSLQRARLYYWGDLDEHGFIMLSQMRELYPQVISVLMDLPTLQNHLHELHTVRFEGKQIPRLLTRKEQEAYHFIKENSGRIEQERIRNDYLLQYFSQLST